MSLESSLYRFCTRCGAKSGIAFLKAHIPDKINVLWDHGECFAAALRSRQSDLFKAMLDYYKETQLDRNQDRMSYAKALEDLRNMMHYLHQNCIDSTELVSLEIRDFMREYISFDIYTDLKDVRSKARDVGIDIPCLEGVDIDESDGLEVRDVLVQLREIRGAIKITKYTYMPRYEAQVKMVGELIEFLRSEYEISSEADALSNDYEQGGEGVGLEEYLSDGKNISDVALDPDGVIHWGQSLPREGALLHRSKSEPCLKGHDEIKLLHSSSESLLVTSDSYEVQSLGEDV